MAWKEFYGRAAGTLGAVLAAFGPVVNAQDIRVVAVTGQQAPGMEEGVEFVAFGADASLQDSGVGFLRALLRGPGIDSTNEVSIWRDIAGLTLVHQSGSEAPGTGGLRFDGFFPVVSNTSGQYAFLGSLTDASEGIWANRLRALELVGRGGDQVAGQPNGTVLQSLNTPHLADSGSLILRGSMRNSRGRIFEAILSDRSGELRAELIQGGEAPGTIKSFLRFNRLVANRNGQTVVEAQLDSSPFESGLWTDRGGGYELLALEGNPAPGWGEGFTFGGGFSPVSMNSNGAAAIRASLDGPGSSPGATFTNRTGVLEPVVVWRDQAPGTPDGTQFGARQDSIDINDHERLLITANLTGGDTNPDNNFGMWAEGRDGQLDLVVRRGDPLPGAPEGTFIDVQPFWIAFNNQYDAAEVTSLIGPAVDFTNDRILLGFDNLGAPLQLLREGQQLDLGGGDSRTVFDFSVQSALTDTSHMYVFAEFADGSGAMLIIVVPAPGVWVLPALGCFGMAFRRRR